MRKSGWSLKTLDGRGLWHMYSSLTTPNHGGYMHVLYCWAHCMSCTMHTTAHTHTHTHTQGVPAILRGLHHQTLPLQYYTRGAGGPCWLPWQHRRQWIHHILWHVLCWYSWPAKCHAPQRVAPSIKSYVSFIAAIMTTCNAWLPVYCKLKSYYPKPWFMYRSNAWKPYTLHLRNVMQINGQIQVMLVLELNQSFSFDHCTGWLPPSQPCWLNWFWQSYGQVYMEPFWIDHVSEREERRLRRMAIKCFNCGDYHHLDDCPEVSVQLGMATQSVCECMH